MANRQSEFLQSQTEVTRECKRILTCMRRIDDLLIAVIDGYFVWSMTYDL